MNFPTNEIPQMLALSPQACERIREILERPPQVNQALLRMLRKAAKVRRK